MPSAATPATPPTGTISKTEWRFDDGVLTGFVTNWLWSEPRPQAVRPILLVHGAGFDATIWHKLMHYTAGKKVNRRLYSLNLRGRSDSLSCDLGKASIHDYAYDVSRVARRIRESTGEKVTIAGWSMGGVACQIAAMDNEDLEEMVLLESMPPAWIFLRGEIVFRILRPYYLKAMFGGHPYRLHPTEARRMVFERWPDPDSHYSRIGFESGTVAKEMIYQLCKVDAKRILCNVRVIGGRHDRLIKPGVQRQIAKKYGVEAIFIDSGHLLPEGDVATIAKLLDT